MAQNPIPPELQKLFNGTRPGQSPVPQMPTSAPIPVPTMGPTIANDPRAVPMMGEWEVRGAGAGQFPLGIPEDKLIPQPVTNTPQVTEGVRAGRAQQRRDQVGGVSAPTLTIQPSRAEQLQGVEAVPFSMTGGATRTEGRVGRNRPEIATPATVDAPSVFSDQPAGQMPSANIGQLPQTPSPFSTEVAAQVNPMMAPQELPQTQAPATQGLTTQSGIPLAQFLGGEAIPEAGLAAESPLYSSESRGISGDAGRDIMAQESAARMAGTFSPEGAGRAVSDRERRGATGELSMADAVDMAGGDRDKARALVVQSRQQQTADQLTPEQRVAQGKLDLDRAKFADEVLNREGPSKELTAAQKEFAKKSGEGAYDWDQGGRASAKENIDKFDGVLNDLRTGQLDTRTLTEFLPLVGDWARSAVNPTGQQGLDTIRGVIFQGLRDTLGAQFTEREGERLVNASYNTKLDEASNIARLEPALERMRATFEAKESLTNHIINGGSVKDYEGQTPKEVYDSFDGGSSGSPIQGDVDVASDADAILAAQ